MSMPITSADPQSKLDQVRQETNIQHQVHVTVMFPSVLFVFCLYLLVPSSFKVGKLKVTHLVWVNFWSICPTCPLQWLSVCLYLILHRSVAFVFPSSAPEYICTCRHIYSKYITTYSDKQWQVFTTMLQHDALFTFNVNT